MENSEHMRYLGALGLLSECSVYVPEDLRESIERAMFDAVYYNKNLEFRRVLNRLELEVRVEGGELQPLRQPTTPPPTPCQKPPTGTRHTRVLRKKRS